MNLTPPLTRREQREAERAAAAASGVAIVFDAEPHTVISYAPLVSDADSHSDLVVENIFTLATDAAPAETVVVVAVASTPAAPEPAFDSLLSAAVAEPAPAVFDFSPVPAVAPRSNALIAPLGETESPARAADDLFQYPAARAQPAPVLDLSPPEVEEPEAPGKSKGSRKPERKAKSDSATRPRAEKAEDKGVNLLALISIVAGVVSAAFAFVPMFAFSALPIGGVALLVGVIALVLPGYRKLVSVVAVLIALTAGGYNGYVQYGDLVFGGSSASDRLAPGPAPTATVEPAPAPSATPAP